MISMVISPLIWVRTRVTLLITPLITTHEPPSTAQKKPTADLDSNPLALKTPECEAAAGHPKVPKA